MKDKLKGQFIKSTRTDRGWFSLSERIIIEISNGSRIRVASTLNIPIAVRIYFSEYSSSFLLPYRIEGVNKYVVSRRPASSVYLTDEDLSSIKNIQLSSVHAQPSRYDNDRYDKFSLHGTLKDGPLTQPITIQRRTLPKGKRELMVDFEPCFASRPLALHPSDVGLKVETW